MRGTTLFSGVQLNKNDRQTAGLCLQTEIIRQEYIISRRNT